MKKTTNMTDMTAGSPLRHLLTFALPLMVGNIFQQLYNLVDSLVVGNYVGANALAAVGTCGSLSFLFFALSSGLALGIGILASQFYGAQNHTGIRAVVANSGFILVTVGLGVSLLGYTGAPALLTLLRVPKDTIYPMSLTYLRINCLGIVFVALYNGVASILRALGDSRTPLYFLIMACIINIVLDLVFVAQLGLGVLGVALATIAAQFASFLVSFVYALKKVSYFQLRKEELKPDTSIIRRCMQLGIPMALQSSLIAISVMVLQGVVNAFGETIMAAYTVVGRVEQLAHMPFSALNAAITSFAGQNKGAGRIDRVRQGYRSAVLVTLGVSMAMLPFFWLMGGRIVGCFVSDPQVIAIGAKALAINSSFYFPLGMIYIPRGLINGCGDARFSLINGITEVICRILFANVLTSIAFIGFWGIWFTEGLTWSVTALVCIIRYHRGKWQNIGILGS